MYLLLTLPKMPVTKKQSAKKAQPKKERVTKIPAYQPDEEYLHNLVCAEVAVQLEKQKKPCHPLTCESKKAHYVSEGDAWGLTRDSALIWFILWILLCLSF